MVTGTNLVADAANCLAGVVAYVAVAHFAGSGSDVASEDQAASPTFGEALLSGRCRAPLTVNKLFAFGARIAVGTSLQADDAAVLSAVAVVA